MPLQQAIALARADAAAAQIVVMHGRCVEGVLWKVRLIDQVSIAVWAIAQVAHMLGRCDAPPRKGHLQLRERHLFVY